MTFEYIPWQRLPKHGLFSSCEQQKLTKYWNILKRKSNFLFLFFGKMSTKSTLTWWGCQEYRKIWILKLLLAEIEPKYIADKFAVVMEKNETTTVGRLLNGKKRRFSKTIFYSCKSKATVVELSFSFWSWKLGMKVPCTLHFDGQSDFIDILSNELCKHNWWYSYHT